MARLTEHYVQGKALAHLKTYYETLYPSTTIFSRTELVTTYKRKRGRADGLLAFRKNGKRVYSVSLEAKSHKTYKSLENIPLDTLLGFVTVVLFMLLAVVVWTILGDVTWWLKLTFSIAIGIIVAVAIIAVLLVRERFDTHGIIEQVKRYPADEKWIALSIDAFKRCSRNEEGRLLLKANASGIGVMIVHSGGKVEIKRTAKQPKFIIPRGYIAYYRIHRRITRWLDDPTNQKANVQY